MRKYSLAWGGAHRDLACEYDLCSDPPEQLYSLICACAFVRRTYHQLVGSSVLRLMKGIKYDFDEGLFKCMGDCYFNGRRCLLRLIE